MLKFLYHLPTWLHRYEHLATWYYELIARNASQGDVVRTCPARPPWLGKLCKKGSWYTAGASSSKRGS